MNKIATPKDLISELQRVLAYASSKKPSRTKLSRDLSALSEKVSSQEKTASSFTITLPVMVGASDYREFKSVLNILKGMGFSGVKLAYTSREDFIIPSKYGVGPNFGIFYTKESELKEFPGGFEEVFLTPHR